MKPHNLPKNKQKNYIFLVLTLVTLSTNFISAECNVWDNIFSNLHSPQYIIPNEFIMNLLQNELPFIIVKFSSEKNIIKIQLMDNFSVNSTISSLESLKSDKQNIIIKNDLPFLNIYVNFTNSTIKFDFDDECYYQNSTFLNTISAKFLLVSYDLLTFFKKTDKFNEYIFTNPVSKVNKRLQNLRQIESKNNKIINALKYILKDVEEDAILRFKVNRQKNYLEEIDIKYMEYEYTGIKVEPIQVTNFDDNEFVVKNQCQKMNSTLIIEKAKDFLILLNNTIVSES